MYWGPRFFYDRYKLPVSITENGLAMRDHVFLDGKVHDPQRIDFMHRYLTELARAIKDGVPVTGYYAWSLLDNFEWSDGYKQRFGLVYVDYQNAEAGPEGFVRLVPEGDRHERQGAGRQDRAAGREGHAVAAASASASGRSSRRSACSRAGCGRAVDTQSAIASACWGGGSFAPRARNQSIACSRSPRARRAR